MKFFVALFIAAPFTALVASAADCSAYGNSCTSQCQSVFSSSASGQSNCGNFTGSCQCLNAQKGNAPDVSKGNQFCSQQKSACTDQICAGQPLDSFSCDPYTASSQCQCKSGSNLRGGAMWGANETACASLIQKCATQICSGKKVTKNTCTSPSDAVCQCEGGNSVNPSQNTNDAPVQLISTVFSVLAIGSMLLFI